MGWLVAFVLGGLGLGAFLRRRRKRRRADQETSHADELKARIAESRAAEVGGEAEEADATIESDLEARRRSVHESARGAIDELS